MNANFQPRRFTLAALRDMLHRIRLEYVDFPGSYRRFKIHGEPHYMRLSPQWPIHVRADDEDALAIISFNIGRGNVPEATPPPPTRT
ncbi:hypothetical protein ACJIZ3_023546 [Penstemon smallii]|uniref:Uncharacterized protein n=1 Tax=Penstemon smallii TaxID=265156 RepID=A0ABD3TPJ7_9LAMI